MPSPLRTPQSIDWKALIKRCKEQISTHRISYPVNPLDEEDMGVSYPIRSDRRSRQSCSLKGGFNHRNKNK